MKYRVWFVVIIAALLLFAAAVASAQDRQPTPTPTPAPAPTPTPAPAPQPAPAPPPTSPAAPGAAAQPVLPWFVMTGRLAFGAGSGSMNFHWNSFGSFLDYNETAGFSAGGMSIIPEAFFMPTSGRHFIISASLPMTVGSGTFTKYNDPTRVIDGQHFTYSNWALAIGLGYQWYFGAEQRTNLILMGHLGGGAYKLTVHWRGDDYTSDSMRSGIFDISVGSTHRFACNFVLGGTLDIWTQQFSGAAGGTNFFDTDIAGGMSQLRLNMIFGYAFF